MKQLAFLIIFSTPSLENVAQISSSSFLVNQFAFTVFCISTLSVLGATPNHIPLKCRFLFWFLRGYVEH